MAYTTESMAAHAELHYMSARVRSRHVSSPGSGQVTLFFKNTDDVEKFAADMVQAVRRAYRHR